MLTTPQNGRLRINTSNSIRLWDVPDPPAMKDIVWYDPDNVPSRLHCLDLRGCCGLNFVFSRLGTLVWVHAQYRNPTLPEDFTIPVEHQVSHHDSVRVFVPLAHGETIDSLCVLRSRVEGPRATRFQGIHVSLLRIELCIHVLTGYSSRSPPALAEAGSWVVATGRGTRHRSFS